MTTPVVCLFINKHLLNRAGVVAQLEGWLLLIPEIRSSYPVISNFICYQLYKKDENKEKGSENDQI